MLGAVGAGFLGCSSPGTSNDGCTNSCENNLWPRLIVDVVADGDAGPESSFRVWARYPDGRTSEGIAKGCPTIANVSCTESFGGGPADDTLTLVLEQEGLEAVEVPVEMSSFNTCGRRIAYVVITRTGGSPRVEPTRYLSPCSGL